MADSVRVYGLQELGAALDLAPEKFERKVLGAATRAGGRVLEEGVRRRAPRLTGELARKVDAKFRVIAKGKLGLGIGLAVIGVVYEGIRAAVGRNGRAPSSEDPGVYAIFNEFGRPGRTGHTHQAARPFMRPAFDEDSDAAVRAFADTATSLLGELVGP